MKCKMSEIGMVVLKSNTNEEKDLSMQAAVIVVHCMGFAGTTCVRSTTSLNMTGFNTAVKGNSGSDMGRKRWLIPQQRDH